MRVTARKLRRPPPERGSGFAQDKVEGPSEGEPWNDMCPSVKANLGPPG